MSTLCKPSPQPSCQKLPEIARGGRALGQSRVFPMSEQNTKVKICSCFEAKQEFHEKPDTWLLGPLQNSKQRWKKAPAGSAARDIHSAMPSSEGIQTNSCLKAVAYFERLIGRRGKEGGRGRKKPQPCLYTSATLSACCWSTTCRCVLGLQIMLKHLCLGTSPAPKSAFSPLTSQNDKSWPYWHCCSRRNGRDHLHH